MSTVTVTTTTVHTDGYDVKGSPITDEMVTAARDELIARINNKIQPTRGTVRAVLEAALAHARISTDHHTRP